MLSQLKKLTSSKYFSLSFVFVLANLVANILNYLFHFFASRTYGPEVYGEIVSLFSHLYILGVPSLIFTTFIIKYIGQGKSQKQQLQNFAKACSVFNLKSPKLLSLLLLVSFSFFFLGRYDNLSLTSSLTLSLVFLLSIFSAYISSFLQAFQAFFILSFALILSTTFKFSGSILAYFSHSSSLNLLWVFLLLGMFFQIYLLFFYFRKYLVSQISTLKTKPLPYKFLFKKFLSHKYILMTIAILSSTAIVNVDVIFARKMLSPHASGLYGAWSMFAKIIMYASGPITTVAFVFFADNKHKKDKRKLLLFSSLINIFAGLLLLSLYAYFGKLIVASLFGPSFLSLSPHLAKAALFGLFYSLIANLNNYFVAQDSYASLFTFFFLIVQIILLPLFGHSFVALLNIQLYLSLLTLAGQFLFLIF